MGHRARGLSPGEGRDGRFCIRHLQRILPPCGEAGHGHAGGAPVSAPVASSHEDLQVQLEQAREQVRRLRMIIEGSAAGTWEWNPQTGQMRVNERWAQIVGYTLQELWPVSAETFARLAHPDDVGRSDALLQAHLDGITDAYECLLRMRHRQGHWVWVQDRGRVYEWDAQGRPLWMAGAHTDVSDRQQALAEARLAEERSRVTLDAVTDLVLSIGLDGRIEHANASAQRMLGDAAGTPLQGRQVAEVMQLTTEYAPSSPLDLTVLLDPDSNAVDLHADLLLVQRNAMVPVDLSQAWLHDDENRLRGAVWVVRDVTQLRARQREARQLAELDPLTELVNRRGFEAHLQQAIGRVERTGQAASLMFIDLDQFKPVNDTWGHLAGDSVLWAVANLLRHGVRDSDVVARLGGDEFAVILAGCSLRHARRIAGELLVGITGQAIPWEQQRIRIGVSIGIAAIRPGMDVDGVVAAADAQCYRAKAAGRNTVCSERKGDGGD